MPRTARIAPGGMVFHVLNRGVGRMRLFLKDADFEAFERTIEKTLQSRPMRICSYCLMPNHWHLVLWPERNGDLAIFIRTATNRFRWNRTSTSIKSCVMSSATRCEPMRWHGPKTGVGRVFGVESTAKPRTDAGSAPGRRRVRALGWIWSTSHGQRRSWKPSVAVSCVASLTAARTG